ncbi:hypothetical protein [Rufibacter ruber]|uniref:hypothetical protein n=1 Tax=Rufibacter ruber TaxID=1783499 RepID=UPI000829F4DC|nr:hypothetical protein [Rufibacter ruber]
MRPFLYCLLLCGCLSCGTSTSDQKGTATAASEQGAAVDSTSSPSAAPAVDSAYQIVPGERMGQTSLNESPEAVAEALGKPDASNAAMGKSLSTWYSSANGGKREELNVYTVREKTGTPQETVGVHQVRVTSSAFKVMPSGLSTGSTLPQIREAFNRVRPLAHYQYQGRQRAYLYDATGEGLAFEITGPDSTCVAIILHQKGKEVTSAYLPIHEDLVKLHQQ